VGQPEFNFDGGNGNQERELARVTSRIGLAVLAFCLEHEYFHAGQLRA
jgi:hypothetical protein